MKERKTENEENTYKQMLCNRAGHLENWPSEYSSDLEGKESMRAELVFVFSMCVQDDKHNVDEKENGSNESVPWDARKLRWGIWQYYSGEQVITMYNFS